LLTHLLLLLLLLLQASLADHRVPDYVAEDPLIKVMGVTRDQVVEALQSVGFSDDLLVSKSPTRIGLMTLAHVKLWRSCGNELAAVDWLQRRPAGECESTTFTSLNLVRLLLMCGCARLCGELRHAVRLFLLIVVDVVTAQANRSMQSLVAIYWYECCLFSHACCILLHLFTCATRPS
jgi:hypothetical protein